MAGDWIKFETTTPDKPEVYEMASLLEIDPDAVVGKLMRTWAWFDQHTNDGNAPVTVETLLDRKVGVTGFTEAMAKVGWLLRSGKQIRLANFERHNGQTAKDRALTARRKAKCIAKKGNGASVTRALPREEKNITRSCERFIPTSE